MNPLIIFGNKKLGEEPVSLLLKFDRLCRNSVSNLETALKLKISVEAPIKNRARNEVARCCHFEGRPEIS